MAYEIPGFEFTLIAAADLSASQYRFVAVNAAGQAALAGAGVMAAGVLQNNPALGHAAGIRALGISKVEAGAALAAGAPVTGDATSRAVTAVAGDHIHGIALMPATDAGEIIPVLLKGSGTV